METLKKILKRKHLLVIGSTEIDRKKFITEIIKIAGFETFRFPPKMKLFDDYFYEMKKMKLYRPWYEARSYNGDAIWDFHRDWLEENNSLLIMEEFQYMEECWKFEILRLCIEIMDSRKKGEDAIHLIISQKSENNLVEQMTNKVLFNMRKKERRTSKQIIEQNLKIIDISNKNYTL